jgi:hypothetical protein
LIAGLHQGCTNSTSPTNTTRADAKDSTGHVCRQFDPPCGAADEGWTTTPGSSNPTDVMGACSGNWIGGAIVDQVTIPNGLAPGAYVLGFRWDCEETSQVWASCADVTLVAA